MSDLISRERLIDEISRDIDFAREKIIPLTEIDAYKVAIRRATGLPAVDAEPVRHGIRTVYTIWHSSAWGEIHTKFECCGFDVRGTKKYNYCPNCGAKMDGGAE